MDGGIVLFCGDFELGWFESYIEAEKAEKEHKDAKRPLL
jgi:hypothetical protein